MKDRVRSKSKLLHNDLTAEQNRWRRVWDSAKRLEWQSEYVLVTHSLLKQQSSNDMTRTTRQFPPSSSGVLQTRHMGLIRSPTDTKRNDVLGCCFFVLSVMEIRLRSVTEKNTLLLWRKHHFYFPNNACEYVFVHLSKLSRTVEDRKVEEKKSRNKKAADSSFIE